MKTIVKMVYGSALYGTSTPTSDTDYKGVFLPDLTDLLLARAPRHHHTSTGSGVTKNTPTDVDTELFSLHAFIDEACKGETFAIDMLHAPHDMLLESTPTWSALRSLRRKFYSKNLKAFVGYARRQAAKYGIKGSRLASARVVLELMEQVAQHGPLFTMSNLHGEIARRQLEHVHIDDDKGWVEVCGKKLLWNARISEYLPTVRRFVSEFGDRAVQAELNQGIDWKALSHALRAAIEVRQIIVNRDIIFPLTDAPYLLQVKQGLLPFQQVQADLERRMDELEHLAATCDLPDHVDRSWWDDWLKHTLQREYGIDWWAPHRSDKDKEASGYPRWA